MTGHERPRQAASAASDDARGAMADDEEPDCCPLCMEELDLTDKTFNACPCGYQVCLWCWHQIKNEYNGLCPACRAPYAELSKHKNPLDREDVLRRTKQRKQREKSERRSAGQRPPPVNRKSLANVRVMQRNLVYVIGLPQYFADEEVLRSDECFGQYGKIVKAVVNKAHLHGDRSNATASAYITFARKDDALQCIMAVDGFLLDGALLRASFGTTKYCNFFLRNLQCNNPECLYLHELGDPEDSFTKEEMQTALHSGKAFREVTGVSTGSDPRVGSRFPPAPGRRNDRYRDEDDDDDRTELYSSSSPSSTPPQPAAAAAAAAAASPLPVVGRRRPIGTPSHTSRHATTSSRLESSEDSSPGSISPGSRHLPGSVCRDEPYSKIVAGTASPRPPAAVAALEEQNTSSATSTVTEPAASIADTSTKPNLRVDTSVGREDNTEVVETVVGPLEALKLATGSTVAQPAWAQPFPSTVTARSDDVDDTDAALGGAVFSPFGLGFDGGIRDSSSTSNDAAWPSTATMDAPPLPPQSALSSSSFASIDAIFSQRTESSTALAGLLGVELSSTPLTHGTPTNGTSRFAFANSRVDSRRSSLSHDRNLYDNRQSYSGYDRPSTFSSPHDTSMFPPLGAAQSATASMPPLPPSGGSYHGLHRTASMPSNTMGSMMGDSSSGNGLAFLQQMLPNVNISYGGDFPNSASAQGPPPSSSGRRLFQRSHSTGGDPARAPVDMDAWQTGSGFASSAVPSFHDPAIVSLSAGNTMPSGFYGDNEGERRFNSFGDTFRQSGSLLK